MQVKVLKELKRDNEEEEKVYKELEQELLREYPGHLPLLSAILASLTSLPADKKKERLQVTDYPVCTPMVLYLLARTACLAALYSTLPAHCLGRALRSAVCRRSLRQQRR